MSSMKENPVPALADVSDLFLSVESRPDAISFSDETAVGKYPVECVQMMDQLITEMETQIESPDAEPLDSAAMECPEKVIRAAKSGRYRSIISAQKDRRVASWLTMHRGVYVMLTSDNDETSYCTALHAYAKKIGIIRDDEHLKPGSAD